MKRDDTKRDHTKRDDRKRDQSPALTGKRAASMTGLALLMSAATTTALAQHADNGISLLAAQSPVAEEVHRFHNWILMPVMTGISVFVLALLVWVCLRYNEKANPEPRRFSHNTLVEILWGVIPLLIVLFIGLFSVDLLHKEDKIPDGKIVTAAGDGVTTEYVFANDFSPRRLLKRPDHISVSVGGQKLSAKDDYKVQGWGEPEILVTLAQAPAAGQDVVIKGGRTSVGLGKFLGVFGEDHSEIAIAPTITIKVNGYQWGWIYSYPDFGDFEVTSNMLAEDQTTPELYRLAVDNPIYVPAGETIRVITTARDVIHSWAMPNFAIKIDAVPGRLNETWFSAPREGTYYGQCSEICGVRHSFMPIEVRVVSRPQFNAWVNEQRTLNGMEPIDAMGIADAGMRKTAGLAAVQH